MTTKKTTKELAAEAGAKVPADHAAKAEATGDLIKVNVRGFDLEFDPNDLDDDDLMTALEHGSPNLALQVIVGDAKRVAEIKDSLRVDGKLKRSDLLMFVTEVIQAGGQGNA